MKAVTALYPVTSYAGILADFFDVSEDHAACIIRVDVLRVAHASNTLMSTDEMARRHNQHLAIFVKLHCVHKIMIESSPITESSYY